MAGVGRRLIPLFDRILVERFVPETRTKGGIMIPEKAQAKVQSATVVAVGPGARNEKGDHIPPSVKEGDKVLLPEYGGTKIEIEDKDLPPAEVNTDSPADQVTTTPVPPVLSPQEYFMFRDGDILGKWAN